ncbi:MAG: hypothetical protein HC927_10855 [Deltaproteobacteria bacterium]|nr:hypothetical protein [Deltaproteobacteria bacterium]
MTDIHHAKIPRLLLGVLALGLACTDDSHGHDDDAAEHESESGESSEEESSGDPSEEESAEEESGEETAEGESAEEESSEEESSEEESSEEESSEEESSEEESTETGPPPDPPEATTLSLSYSAIKQFDFTWPAAAGATYYRLLESPTLGEDFAPIVDDIEGEAFSIDRPCTCAATPATSSRPAIPAAARPRSRSR